MKLVQKWLLLKLCLLLAMPINVWPQALPVANPTLVNRASSGLIQQAMMSRGFAANDPRFLNTIARATPYIATAVAGAAAVTAGAITAPAWATVALGVGIGTVVGYVVNLGLDSLVRWLFRTDKNIDESSAAQAGSSTCAMAAGGFYYLAGALDSAGVLVQIRGCDGEAVARQVFAIKNANTPSLQPGSCIFGVNDVTCGGIVAGKQASGAPQSCPAGTYLNGTQCVGYSYVVNAVAPAVAVAPQTAISHIPASDLDRQLNPAVIAGLANRVWQQTAAQPGYDGIPYPTSNPITPAEAVTWAAANPAAVPTVRDFTSPNPVTTANPTPWAIPANPSVTASSPANATLTAAVANAGTINPASANPLQNLGADPVTPAPTLEPTPTAPMILAPILNMLPSLRTFTVTGHTATCPKPTVSLVGKTITMDAHCTVIDSIKPILQTAMLFAWAAIALFIILAA
jgi:hypothetical protein